MPVPPAITVAATESDGDAGVQADLKVLAAMRCRGTAVVTAVVTAGNLDEPDVHPLPPRVVRAQLDTALAAGPMAAAKVGMAADADTVGVVAAAARAGHLPRLVVDPVLTGPHGRRGGLAAAYRRLLPLATVVTPDLEEASALVGWPVATPADMGGAASQLAAQGAAVVVVTGGGLPGDEVIDVVWTGTGVRQLRGRRVTGVLTRGAGCAFSAAITAQLAYGVPPLEAVDYAKLYASRVIAGASDPAHGGLGGADYFEWSTAAAA